MTLQHLQRIESGRSNDQQFFALQETFEDDVEFGCVEHAANTGREWDGDVEMFYYRARWYDPNVGRFISEDPIGFGAGDPNLSRYVLNDPLSFTDPSGLGFFDEIGEFFEDIGTSISNAVEDVVTSIEIFAEDVGTSVEIFSEDFVTSLEILGEDIGTEIEQAWEDGTITHIAIALSVATFSYYTLPALLNSLAVPLVPTYGGVGGATGFAFVGFESGGADSQGGGAVGGGSGLVTNALMALNSSLTFGVDGSPESTQTASTGRSVGEILLAAARVGGAGVGAAGAAGAIDIPFGQPVSRPFGEWVPVATPSALPPGSSPGGNRPLGEWRAVGNARGAFEGSSVAGPGGLGAGSPTFGGGGVPGRLNVNSPDLFRLNSDLTFEIEANAPSGIDDLSEYDHLFDFPDPVDLTGPAQGGTAFQQTIPGDMGEIEGPHTAGQVIKEDLKALGQGLLHMSKNVINPIAQARDAINTVRELSREAVKTWKDTAHLPWYQRAYVTAGNAINSAAGNLVGDIADVLEPGNNLSTGAKVYKVTKSIVKSGAVVIGFKGSLKGLSGQKGFKNTFFDNDGTGLNLRSNFNEIVPGGGQRISGGLIRDNFEGNLPGPRSSGMVAPKSAPHFSGTNKPWTSGATPNSKYTHIGPDGKAVQNAIYDANGNVIGHVDFKNHGPGAPSGHGHQFPVPGNPASGHGPGNPHIPPTQLPPGWADLPPGVPPRTPIGQ